MNASHVLCPVVLFYRFAVVHVDHFKVVFLLCVVVIDSVGGYLLGNIREYAGRGSVSTGAGVERISVWASL